MPSTSDNQHDPARPWTPAPWGWTHVRMDTSGALRFQNGYLDGGDGTSVIGTNEHPTDELWATPADAALIALAPEMAEAILAFADSWIVACDDPGDLSSMDEADRSLWDLALKLRALSRPAEEATR